ncbi:hypothetical protein LINPERHAP1_LOCUS33489 [Linum perenne]
MVGIKIEYKLDCYITDVQQEGILDRTFEALVDERGPNEPRLVINAIYRFRAYGLSEINWLHDEMCYSVIDFETVVKHLKKFKTYSTGTTALFYVLEDEFATVIQTLKIILEGYKKVHLQLDSLADITAILGDQEEDSRHGRTLDTINKLRSRNWEVTISHIFREGNNVVDLLAHHGHSTLDFGDVDCIYPHEVDRAIWSSSFAPRHIS